MKTQNTRKYNENELDTGWLVNTSKNILQILPIVWGT